MSLKLLVLLPVLLLVACAHQHPQTIIQTTNGNNQTIITPVPADREVVLVPRGYTHCYVVPASWYQGAWVAPHKVCEYVNRTKPTWISGYWHCTHYDMQNTCSHWKWTPSHWSNAITTY
jgi:hypothetical protein